MMTMIMMMMMIYLYDWMDGWMDGRMGYVCIYKDTSDIHTLLFWVLTILHQYRLSGHDSSIITKNNNNNWALHTQI